MFKNSDWSVDGTKILSRRELGAVVADLATRCGRSRPAERFLQNASKSARIGTFRECPSSHSVVLAIAI
jgi:hypothetical protein